MINPFPEPRALIFDMDGVLIDNHAFHLAAWVEFCKRYGISITAEEFHKKMFGGSNRNLMEKVFGRSMNDDELQKKADEKESIYRELHSPSIKPLNGVKEFILNARAAGFKTAVATAAPRVNLDFTIEMTGMQHLFDIRLDDSMVRNGKPNPEIYIKAASLLDTKPEHCIVFEDSLTGIKAAQSAHMRVIGVATSLSVAELSHTWKVIHDFTELTIHDLIR
jgi:beta-phosphoglucomutase